MGKGSLARVAAALAIISIYLFLFGITGRIDSLAESIPEERRSSATEPIQAAELTAPPDDQPIATTTAPAEERTVYTYATTINVKNGKKPSLADYTATEALLIVPESLSAAPAASETADVVLDASSFVTEATTTTRATTTTTPPTTTALRTAAATSSVTTEATTTTTAPSETTTTTPPPTEDEITDLEDDTDETVETDALEDDPDETVEPEYDDPDETSEPEYDDPDESDDEELTPSTVTLPSSSASDETLTVNAGGTLVTGDAATIVAQAVMAEIGDSFHDEAIKAQAVATYTYFKYYNMNRQNAYAVLKTPSDNVTRCVNEVIGQAIYYDGAVVQAVYCASSAGYTASAENVWGIDYPYLRSRRNEFDVLYDINYGRKVNYTADEVRAFVRNNTGIELNDDPASWFEITSYVDGAYVGTMTIGGLSSFTRNGVTTKITGRAFRETVMEFNLRSSSFDIEYDPATATFTFTTYGYGHGVGLSQHGANILATEYGYTYDQILTYYYQGTTIA
ncbi:MAG: SpoIID/LytB domain-containing protein [Bacteroides sp.]|nr:SpoIID/LytB domain-containing protein [Eubacterium sp.]MCM1418697.1 SpoIID/LytB domain-containing protein [Roseburia sp.]MCM1462725.1 SpoIID/LytB domain-containing protein [Bacteroides sp.]